MLKASAALPMSRREVRLFKEVAGDRDPPKRPVPEVVAVVGRGGGKDAIASALATHAAVSVDARRLRPGERAVVLCLATDKDQAAIALSYIRGYFENVGLLSLLVDGRMRRDDRVDLKNRVSIIVTTNNFRAPRGRTVICAIYDECAFWKSENTTAPDFETDAAIAPGLARWPGSLKILISSAYRRTGLLHDRYKRGWARSDEDCLVVLGTSLQFNPMLDEKIIQRELEKDRERASAEYLSQWRNDLSSFVSRDVVESLIDRGVRERAPEPGVRYMAFADESGGGSSNGDASSLVICHIDRNRVVHQDLIRVWKPPFSPAQVIVEKCRLLRAYRCSRVTADRWAFGLAADAYRTNGIRFEPSLKVKSDLYLDFLDDPELRPNPAARSRSAVIRIA